MHGSEDVRAPVASEEPRSGCTAVGVGSNIKKLDRTEFLALVLTAGCRKLLDNCRAEDLAVSLAPGLAGGMELRPWLHAPAA